MRQYQRRTYNVTIGRVGSTSKGKTPRKPEDAPTEDVDMKAGNTHIKIGKVHGPVIGTVVVNGDMHIG